MALTSLDHHQTSKTMKNDGKSRRSATTENEEQVTSISSNGKATISPKQRGNLPHVSKEAVKKFSKSTATIIALTPDLISMAFEIPTLVLTDSEGRQMTLIIHEPVLRKKEVFRLMSGLYPNLAPPTEEELAAISTTLYVPTPPSFF